MKTMPDIRTLRAWWWQRQGLDGSLDGKPAGAVLERSGWARSVGGASPYLTLQARAGIARQRADAAVAGLEIHELPAARGCTYVVPAADFALALRAGGGADPEMALARTLGVTDAEVDRLCAAVLLALEAGAMGPAELREKAGPTCRDLGPLGKKKGLSSTMPLALGRLQSEGAIRRVAENGRLDVQRYRYVLWKPAPLDRGVERGDVHVELARHYFHWIGPARLSDFQWFSGLGVKAARAATAPLALSPVDADDRLMLHEDAERLASFTPPKEPQYALVANLDALVLLRRDLASLLEPADAARKALSPKGPVALGALADLPSHAILDRGRVVGLWEYDPETASIAWWSFVGRNRALQAAVERTEAYVRDELGDARAFSLDSPSSRAPRIAALREAGR